jgi:hypothetical protein
MTESKMSELEFETQKTFVAYDADSGEILSVHEVMSESGYSKAAGSETDCEAIRHIVGRDFERRSIEVMEIPKDVQFRQDASYWVDPLCGELKELSAPARRFREFIAEEESF